MSVAIIGAGCAGLSAAIYLARANYKPIVFAGDLEHKGGLLTKTSVVENYPGFPDGIQGYDLILNTEQQAIKFGAQIIDETVIKADLINELISSLELEMIGSDASVRSSKLIYTENKEYKVDAIIIATGSSPNKLGLDGENELWGHSISSCAVCDGALYKNKNIMVVGGGDTACEHALFLTKFSNVTLIHRKDRLRASKIMQDRVLNNPKINILFNTEIKEFKFCENKKLTGIITNSDQFIPVNGLFYGLGLKPNNELFINTPGLEIDTDGYIVKKFRNETSIKGVFVAGDITDKFYRQAIVAAGDGCMAALDCIEYLSKI